MTEQFLVQKRIDEICYRLEEVWSSQQRPDSGRWLKSGESDYRSQLQKARLQIDVELRINDGQNVCADVYRDSGLEAIRIVQDILAAQVQGILFTKYCDQNRLSIIA